MKAKVSEQSSVVRSRWVIYGIIAALAIWMAIVWIHFGRTVIRFYSPLPYWDYWDTVGKIDRYRQLDIRVLWQQHNEHRIVFPEIVFAADYLFFRGREILPVALSAFLFFSIWLVLSRALLRDRSPQFLRVCGVLIAGIVLGWEGGALQLSNAFLLQWSLMLAAAAMALFLLTGVPTAPRPWIYLTGAILCSAICNYTSANGLLLWPVVFLAAWILGLTKRQMAILAAGGIGLAALYFVGYQFLHDANIGLLLTHPLYAAGFVATYLGMPFSVIRPWIGISVGFAELVAYVVFIILAFRRGLSNNRGAIVLLGFYLLCLLTAVATAAGRMNPEDPAFGSATAHRYIMIPLAAHAALILAATWLGGNSRNYFGAAFASVFALGFAFTDRSPHIGDWLAFAENGFSNCQLVSLAVTSDIDDPLLLKNVFPDGRLVRQWLPLLRKNHVSSFADNKTDWLGKPASSVFRFISKERQAGAITASYPIESGLVVLGWTDSPRRIWHPQSLVFLDDQKRIIGYGKKLPAGLPRGLASAATPASIAWVGFVNLRFQSKSFSPYTVENRGKNLFLAGEPSVVPPIRVSHADQIGAPIPSLSWNVRGSWVKNGPLPGTPIETPRTISYYESHAGSDANTGLLMSAPFERPSGNCLALASAHGPSIEGFSERLINADTKETIASVPQVGTDTIWSFWRVDLPLDAQRLQIVAEDHGQGWGQWLAIGSPHICK
ncbi:MAG TPA: PrgI family protein [Bryobacteraceae bacterium]